MQRLTAMGTRISRLILAISFALLNSCGQRNPEAPPLLIVSTCNNHPAQGMHRIASRVAGSSGVQFEASEQGFTFHVASRDMPPGMLNVIKVKNGNASLEISNADLTFESEASSAFPTLSEVVQERDIRA